MQFAFNLNKYNLMYEEALKVELILDTVKSNIELSSVGIISSDILNDFVLSSVGKCFLTEFNGYENNNPLKRFQESIEGLLLSPTNVLNLLSVCASTLVGILKQFEVLHCPTLKETDSTAVINSPDSTYQDDIINTYKAPLSAVSGHLVSVNELTYDIGEMITESYKSINSILSQVLPASNSSNVIAISQVYQFLLQLMSILERLKLFRYTFNYKVNHFSGNMVFHKCQNIFPELPVNHEKYTDMISYYGAILVSPLIKHYDINIYKSGDVFSKYASLCATLFINTNTEWTFDLLNPSTTLIFMDSSVTSDEPTFDLLSKDGSNGEFRYFKKITNNTYKLTNHFNEIVELFDLVLGQQISAKTLLLAFTYIFELWHQNIQVCQCDVYACHYNCHINDFSGRSDIIDEVIQINTYTVDCTIDYYVSKDASNPFDSYYLPMLSLGEYQKAYQFIFEPGNTVEYNLLYPVLNIEDSKGSYIPLSAYCIINTASFGDIQINIPIERQVSFGQSYTDILTIKNLITSSNVTAINNADISDNMLSAVGNLHFHFCYYNTEDDPRIDIKDQANGRLVFDNDSVNGYIYADYHEDSPGNVDTRGMYSGYYLSSFMDCAADGIMRDVERGNSSQKFALLYKPVPSIEVKEPQDVAYRKIDPTNPNTAFLFTYINADKIGTAMVIATAASSNKIYKGTLRAEYTIYELPRKSFNSLEAEIESVEDVYYAPFEPPTLNIFEFGLNPIPTELYTLTYEYPPGGTGTAKVIATPSTGTNFGQVYYKDSLYQTFQVAVRSDSSLKPIGGLETTDVLFSFILDWDSNTVDTLTWFVNGKITKSDWKGSDRSAGRAFKGSIDLGSYLPADCNECWLSFKVGRWDESEAYVTGIVSVLDFQLTIVGTVPYALRVDDGIYASGADIHIKFSTENKVITIMSILSGSGGSMSARRVLSFFLQYESWESFRCTVILNLTYAGHTWTSASGLTSSVKRANLRTNAFTLKRAYYKNGNTKIYNNAWDIYLKDVDGARINSDPITVAHQDTRTNKTDTKINSIPNICNNDDILKTVTRLEICPKII